MRAELWGTAERLVFDQQISGQQSEKYTRPTWSTGQRQGARRDSYWPATAAPATLDCRSDDSLSEAPWCEQLSGPRQRLGPQLEAGGSAAAAADLAALSVRPATAARQQASAVWGCAVGHHRRYRPLASSDQDPFSTASAFDGQPVPAAGVGLDRWLGAVSICYGGGAEGGHMTACAKPAPCGRMPPSAPPPQCGRMVLAYCVAIAAS